MLHGFDLYVLSQFVLDDPRDRENIRRQLADCSIGIEPPRLLYGRAANYGSIINPVPVVAKPEAIRLSQGSNGSLAFALRKGHGASPAVAREKQERT